MNKSKVPLVVGCNYHTSWQSNSKMRFVLGGYNVKTKKAFLYTRSTGKQFSTNIEDLIFIESRHNIDKAHRIVSELNMSLPIFIYK